MKSEIILKNRNFLTFWCVRQAVDLDTWIPVNVKIPILWWLYLWLWAILSDEILFVGFPIVNHPPPQISDPYLLYSSSYSPLKI